MDKKEIKDYLKRVDELETKLTGEDKETYAWLIYGYNQCAKLLNETEQQVKKQKEVIDNIQNFIKEFHKNRNMFKWNEQDYIDVILKLEKMINEKEVE
jgi:hypothetical protein